MKFSYKKINSSTYRPIIPIELCYRNQSLRYEVLVDSGADICIFDSSIGEILGLNIESGKEYSVGGVTPGVSKYYVHNITLRIGGWEHKIAAGFMAGLNTSGYGILGQKGFFDLHQVKFDYKKGSIEIK